MDFRLIKEEDILKFPQYFREKVESAKAEIERLLKNKDYNYNSFIKPLVDILHNIEEEFTKISHLNSVNNSKDTQEAYKNSIPLITDFTNYISLNKDIYNRYVEILQKDKSINSEQKIVLEKGIRDFKLAGVHLKDEEKKRISEINLKINELGNTYFQNILNDTNKFTIEVDENVLGEMPQSEKKAHQKGEKFVFGLQMPSYISFMTYCTDRSLREKVYKAYMTRAPQNEEIIEDILSKRYEKAKMLDFENYAEYSIASKAAKSVKTVIDFLNSMSEKSKDKARKELNMFEEFATKYGIDKLESYDLMFITEKYRKEVLNFSDEELRPYFEKNRVIQGLFDFLNKLFDLRFEKVDAILWHDKAECFKVFYKNSDIGLLFLDLEARKGKRDGAWMDNWTTRYIDSSGKKVMPKVFVVANFPESNDDNPSLLRHRDVETLFHEMGHALHHLLSKVDEYFISGVNGIEWDLVEFPSQLLENFSFEDDIIKDFAEHFESKRRIPEELLIKLKKNKYLDSAMGFVRQLEFSLFDMLIHLEKKITSKEVEEILEEVREKVNVIKPPKYAKFQNQFSHIFAGGYAAGYYSYKWAERISANAFYDFINNGIFNKSFADKFLNEVLSLGGSKNFEEVYESFSNKKVDNNCLLKLYGINN